MNKEQKVEKPREKKSVELDNNTRKVLEDKDLETKDSFVRQGLSYRNRKGKMSSIMKKKESQLKFNKTEEASIPLREKIKKKKERALSTEISLLKEKLKQALNDNLYLRAEFENFKKRSAEESKQLVYYGEERFISALANEVLDDLDRAMTFAQGEKSFENLKKGLEMIQKKLSQLLSSFGVEILDPIGKAFDPAYQEALSHVKTSKVPEGYVAETFKKAYKLHDKIIRPAQVVLAKKKEDV